MTPVRRDLALFGAALAARVAHLAAVRPGPLFRYLFIDSERYHGVGTRLAEGGGWPDGVFFMNVLYGGWLGAVYAVAGSGDGGRLVALALQVILGAASTVLLARLGDALGRPREGLLAAALLVFYGPAVFYDAALLTPGLLLFLGTAALLVAVRNPEGRPAGALGLGLLVGLLVLGRANHALLLPLYAAPWLRRGRRGLVAIVLLTAGAAAVVAPITLRNWRVSGEFVPVTANGGMALWAGNHPGATGIYSAPAFLTNPVPEKEAEDYRAEASRRAGRELSLAESSRFWIGETVRYWGAEPMESFRLAIRKLRLWFHATESQTNLSYYFAMDQSTPLAIFRLNLGWILPLAMIGLGLEGRRLRLPAAVVGVSLLTCLLFYVSSEYRHPVVPVLLLFAAAGAVRLRELLRAGALWPRRIVAGAIIVGLFVFVNSRDPFLTRLQSRRIDYLNFGTLAAQAGEMEDAEAFLRRSIAIDPAFEPSHRKLAEVYARTGRMAEAAAETRRAAELAGVTPGAAQIAREEADRLFREGQYEEAGAAFRRLAESGGGSTATALNNAGLCAMRLRQPAEADSLFLAAIAADPTYASPVVHRGRLALALGDSAAAATRAGEAIALAPDDGRAHRLLARATGGGE